jgi:hypothetical protein
MKKVIGLFLSVSASILIFGCATTSGAGLVPTDNQVVVVVERNRLIEFNLPKIEEINSNTPSWLGDVAPEDMIWGIGEGYLSTLNASCEQAKFNAQVDICRRLATIIRVIEHTSTDPSNKQIIDRLNLYENEFYVLLSILASEQLSFELSEFIIIERRTKTADGHIWYLLSLRKNDAERITNIVEFGEFYENYYKDLENQLSE